MISISKKIQKQKNYERKLFKYYLSKIISKDNNLIKLIIHRFILFIAYLKG